MGVVPYLGFLITLASCYRLAKFNVDTRQTDSFIGLPTPANAFINYEYSNDSVSFGIMNG